MNFLLNLLVIFILMHNYPYYRSHKTQIYSIQNIGTIFFVKYNTHINSTEQNLPAERNKTQAKIAKYFFILVLFIALNNYI